ncbi:MAG: hypothetical protein DHS20C16_13200 [Phycisphaerae bacterium]|nr:MAG: hypothetical protein DHS20C16_13200 [Phycisphaerae bacterium]
MKAVIFGTVLLIAAPLWAADATKGKVVTEKDGVLVVESVNEGNVQVKVVAVTGDEVAPQRQGAGQFVIKMEADGDPSEGVVINKRIQVMASVDEDNSNRGWLGVYLGQVATKDAEDLDIEGGVRILNVIKESPAEAAGLEKGDIVTSINGQSIAEGVAGLSKVIGDLEPGSEARIGVNRDGRSLELTATLGEPQSGKVELMHTPDVDFADSFRFGPNVWHFEKSGGDHGFTLDENFDWSSLPESLQGLANLNAEFDMSFDNGERVVNIKSNDNGEVVSISQTGDGAITVKRYTEGHEDEADVADFADADALQAADEEAFELYDSHNSRSVYMFRAGDHGGANFTFDIDTDNLEFLHKDLLERIGEQSQITGEAREQLHNALIELKDGAGMGAHAFFMPDGKAKQTFMVNPDGQIELTIRKGDTEVVKVYSDRDDLEDRNPEAFEKFSHVLEADVSANE